MPCTYLIHTKDVGCKKYLIEWYGLVADPYIRCIFLLQKYSALIRCMRRIYIYICLCLYLGLHCEELDINKQWCQPNELSIFISKPKYP